MTKVKNLFTSGFFLLFKSKSFWATSSFWSNILEFSPLEFLLPKYSSFCLIVALRLDTSCFSFVTSSRFPPEYTPKVTKVKNLFTSGFFLFFKSKSFWATSSFALKTSWASLVLLSSMLLALSEDTFFAFSKTSSERPSTVFEESGEVWFCGFRNFVNGWMLAAKALDIDPAIRMLEVIKRADIDPGRNLLVDTASTSLIGGMKWVVKAYNVTNLEIELFCISRSAEDGILSSRPKFLFKASVCLAISAGLPPSCSIALIDSQLSIISCVCAILAIFMETQNRSCSWAKFSNNFCDSSGVLLPKSTAWPLTSSSLLSESFIDDSRASSGFKGIFFEASFCSSMTARGAPRLAIALSNPEISLSIILTPNCLDKWSISPFSNNFNSSSSSNFLSLALCNIATVFGFDSRVFLDMFIDFKFILHALRSVAWNRDGDLPTKFCPQYSRAFFTF